jgi:hypothetical protein
MVRRNEYNVVTRRQKRDPEFSKLTQMVFQDAPIHVDLKR